MSYWTTSSVCCKLPRTYGSARRLSWTGCAGDLTRAVAPAMGANPAAGPTASSRCRNIFCRWIDWLRCPAGDTVPGAGTVPPIRAFCSLRIMRRPSRIVRPARWAATGHQLVAAQAAQLGPSALLSVSPVACRSRHRQCRMRPRAADAASDVAMERRCARCSRAGAFSNRGGVFRWLDARGRGRR